MAGRRAHTRVDARTGRTVHVRAHTVDRRGGGGVTVSAAAAMLAEFDAANYFTEPSRPAATAVKEAPVSGRETLGGRTIEEWDTHRDPNRINDKTRAYAASQHVDDTTLTQMDNDWPGWFHGEDLVDAHRRRLTPDEVYTEAVARREQIEDCEHAIDAACDDLGCDDAPTILAADDTYRTWKRRLEAPDPATRGPIVRHLYDGSEDDLIDLTSDAYNRVTVHLDDVEVELSDSPWSDSPWDDNLDW